jgi:DNA-binding NtrC family response regulator
MLVRYFVARYAQILNRRIERIPAEVMEALTRYKWLRKIRELQNLVESAVIQSKAEYSTRAFRAETT